MILTFDLLSTTGVPPMFQGEKGILLLYAVLKVKVACEATFLSCINSVIRNSRNILMLVGTLKKRSQEGMILWDDILIFDFVALGKSAKL